MGEATKIEWAEHTWSPWRGCAKVSDGCKFCYAEAGSRRNPGVLGVWGPNGTRVVNADFDKPVRWSRRAEREGRRVRVFPSLCDPFEEFNEPDGVRNVVGSLPMKKTESPGGLVALSLDDVRLRFFDVISRTPAVDWLLLTKRPENVYPMLHRAVSLCAGRQADETWGVLRMLVRWINGDPPENVWVGTSVENQETADARLPHLLGIPAVVRWVSYEPALGPVDFRKVAWREAGLRVDTIVGSYQSDGGGIRGGGGVSGSFGSLDWIVVGGESGPNARPFDVAWARSTLDQCKAARVPVFVKQLGARPDPREWWDESESPHVRRVIRDPKGGDPAEWPEDLRVREMPRGVMS